MTQVFFLTLASSERPAPRITAPHPLAAADCHLTPCLRLPRHQATVVCDDAWLDHCHVHAFGDMFKQPWEQVRR